MIDDWGLMENYNEPACCPHCEYELEWQDCDQCGGEGEFDWETLQFDDTLWYQPDDTEECAQCSGAGGWHWCPNRQCPAKLEATP